jgi:hypothetical protein
VLEINLLRDVADEVHSDVISDFLEIFAEFLWKEQFSSVVGKFTDCQSSAA